jgi:hypothetical protein
MLPEETKATSDENRDKGRVLENISWATKVIFWDKYFGLRYFFTMHNNRLFFWHLWTENFASLQDLFPLARSKNTRQICMSLSKRSTTLAASTRSGGEQHDGGLRPVHRTSVGSASKGKGGRGTSTKK